MFGLLWSDVFGSCVDGFFVCKGWWLNIDKFDLDKGDEYFEKYNRNYINKK